MKEIVNISSISPLYNYTEWVEVGGEKIKITRYGTDFNLDLMGDLIKLFDGKVDVICLSGLPTEVRIGRKAYLHKKAQRLKTLSTITPVVDGTVLKDLYSTAALKNLWRLVYTFFEGKNVCQLSGITSDSSVEFFRKKTRNLYFADLFMHFRLPFLIHGGKSLRRFYHLLPSFLFFLKMNSRHSLKLVKRRYFAKAFMRKMQRMNVIVGDTRQMEGLDLSFVKGKTIILDYASKEMTENLLKHKARNVIGLLPHFANLSYMNYPIAEGILQALKQEAEPLTEADVRFFMNKLKLAPEILHGDQTPEGKNVFSFIVHPLTIRDLFRLPILRPLGKVILKYKFLERMIEMFIGLVPGLFYGKITGIKSELTGQEVEGLVYTILETPKIMMKTPPESIYRKLIGIACRSKQQKAQIAGLGAYTKIVGDAGVTVSKRSPIPVTTGNSLSCASTLWAAFLTVDKMGIVTKQNDFYDGCAMVIGATGSIGKVSAKLLAQKWKELVIVAPNEERLNDLKHEIEQMNEVRAKIVVSTNPDLYTSKCHLIITTTSAKGEKILDIMKVRPGCVICDVSRPFDISKEDAMKRPDVLVIASGEVELPGKVKVSCDIGLKDSTVYACLAETAVLALEGRFECFTLSRNICYEKVREIDMISRKHGVRLAAIMGHDLEITDEEIGLCREHALKKLQECEA